MIALADILADAEPIDGGFRVAVPEQWRQGRTTYGGFSAALALHAAQIAAPGLPPLRSAQVAYVGPLAETIEVRATVLRHGRTAGFVQTDISGAGSLGFRASFIFMASRESRMELDQAAPTEHRPPAPGTALYSGPEDLFTGRFEFLDLKEHAPGPAEWLRWARLREGGGLDPAIELLAIGDALPPAAIKLLGGFAPLGTLGWTMNLLTPAPATREGWWLLHARADLAQGGFSSQRMTIWNADGACVAEGMQSVAVFA